LSLVAGGGVVATLVITDGPSLKDK
jgi:hypothetical protein